MTSPLARYTPSPFEQGPAGASSAEIYDQLSDSRDFFKKVGVQQEEESKRIATNAALAEAGQLGWDMDQIQKKAPDLYAKWANDPMVDMATMSDAMRLRGTTASTLLKDASAIKADTASINAEDASRQYDEARLKALLADEADEERKTTGFAGLNAELAPGGALDQERDKRWAAEVEKYEYTPEEQNILIANGHLQGLREDIMADPQYVRGLVSRHNVTPSEVEIGTTFGRDNKFAKEALATANAEVYAEQEEARNVQLENTRLAAGGNAQKTQFNPDTGEFEAGESISQVSLEEAQRHAGTVGMDMEDKTTVEVVKFLRDNFPDGTAFPAMLKKLRGPDNVKTFGAGVKQEILAERRNLKEKYKMLINQSKKGPRGGSATESGWNHIKVLRGFEAGAKAEAEAAEAETAAKVSPTGERTLFDINKPQEVEQARERQFGPVPSVKNLQESADYYNNSADIIEEELKSYPPTVIGRSSAQRDIPKYLKILRTGYSTAARIGPPASFAERKLVQEKALKALRELRGVAAFQKGLSESPTGDDITEREFLRKLNK